MINLKNTKPLFLFCLLTFCLLGCVKKEPIVENIQSLLANNVPKMQGIRTFSNFYHTTAYLGHIDTTIPYPDTAFVIEVINDSTISFLDRTLYFYSYRICNPSDSKDLNSFLYFENPLGCIHNFEAACYYYKKDSIAIYFSGGGLGGSWNESYFSKN